MLEIKKNKIFTGLFLISALLISGLMWASIAEAALFNDTANGNWNDGATWGNASPGVEGTDYPGASDDATIDSNTVTLAAANQNVRNIRISAGGTLDGVLGNTLTVSGNWDSTGGTFNANSSIVEIGTNGNSNTIKTDPASGFIFYSLTVNTGANIAVDPLDTNGFRIDGIFTISGIFDIPQNIEITSRWANSLIINNSGELTGQGTYTRDVDAIASHIINNGTISIDTFKYRVREWGVAQPITATTYGNNLVIKNLGSNPWNSYIGCVTEPACPALVVPGNFYLYHDRVGFAPWFPAGITLFLDNSIYDIPITVNGDLILGMDPNTHTCESTSYPPGPACGCGILNIGNSTVTVSGDLKIYDNIPPVAASDCDSQIIATDGTPIINVAGDVFIGNAADQGEAALDAGASSINISGNWDSTFGIFNSGTSTVTLNGTGPQDITSGGNAFNDVEITNSSAPVTFADDLTTVNFTCTAPSADIKFNAGSTYSIINFIVQGLPSGLITLGSTSPGSQWNLNVSGIHFVSYVQVSDSDASGGSTINCANCIEPADNNINWNFLIPVPTVTQLGMMIFMVLAGLGAVYFLRRKGAKDQNIPSR